MDSLVMKVVQGPQTSRAHLIFGCTLGLGFLTVLEWVHCMYQALITEIQSCKFRDLVRDAVNHQMSPGQHNSLGRGKDEPDV